VRTDRYELKAIEVAFCAAIRERKLLDRQRLKILRSAFAAEFEVSVHGYIYAQDEPLRRFEMKWPASWWQALKEALYRRLGEKLGVVWLASRRWPVRWCNREVNVEVFYPDFRPPGAMHGEKYVLALQPDHWPLTQWERRDG
jgi:hypothetical protein